MRGGGRELFAKGRAEGWRLDVGVATEDRAEAGLSNDLDDEGGTADAGTEGLPDRGWRAEEGL